MKAPVIPQFVENMGHSIIAYLLSVDDTAARAVVEDQAEINKEQSEVLKAYVELCRQVRSQVEDDCIGYHLAHHTSLASGNLPALFASWRRQTGGVPITPDTGDPLTHAFHRLALDLYPLFLLKMSSSRAPAYPLSRIPPHTFGLPGHDEACQEILTDESLKGMLFEGGPDQLRVHTRYRNSAGHGGGLQLAVFPSTILATAYESMLLRGYPSENGFLEAVSDAIRIVRTIACGNVAQVPVLVGFHNIAIETDGIEIDEGSLKPYNAYGEGLWDVIPPEARPATSNNGEQPLGFVLESAYPYKVDFGTPTEASWPQEFYQARESLARLEEDLRLTFTLAIDRKPPAGTTRTWTLITDPLTLGTNISWRQRPVSHGSHHICTESDLVAVRDWYSVIRRTDDSKIELAVSRILSSVSERSNPMDGLVDAVIAWENLFGGNTELGFRISTAIAYLLEETPEARVSIFETVKRLYNDRSKIVHGVNKFASNEIPKKRDDALDIGVRCLRTLYKSRPELIPVSDRCKRILFSVT